MLHRPPTSIILKEEWHSTHKIGNHCRTVHGMLRYYQTPFPYYMLGLSQQFPGAPPPCGLCHSQTCTMHEKVLLQTWKPAIHNCHTHMRTGDTTYCAVSILVCRLSHTPRKNEHSKGTAGLHKIANNTPRPIHSHTATPCPPRVPLPLVAAGCCAPPAWR
jgi:hypothetical protein